MAGNTPGAKPDEGGVDNTSATRDRLRAGRQELEAMIDAVLSIEERRVILVDGFNVLHSVLLKAERDAGWWRREQRERLLGRVAAWPGQDDEIWVAFDGAQPAWSVWAEPVATIQPREQPRTQRQSAQPAEGASGRGVVHALYVESADDWIVRRARRTPHPERTVIVTADRQVSGRARSAGCEIWTPWAFMSRCRSDHADDQNDESDHPAANEFECSETGKDEITTSSA